MTLLLVALAVPPVCYVLGYRNGWRRCAAQRGGRIAFHERMKERS